jgi:hypothetical protein
MVDGSVNGNNVLYDSLIGFQFAGISNVVSNHTAGAQKVGIIVGPSFNAHISEIGDSLTVTRS